MLTEMHNAISNVQYLRHDLMIELGRLEMAMDDASQRNATDHDGALETLQSKYARVSAALGRLPLDC